MNKNVIKLSLSIFAFGITNILFAQDVDEDIVNWYNGKGAGMHTEKAYKKLKKRESKTVIVAIIDSGIDIEHKDLQGKIWTNTGEIAGNGIDDDKNGYIDDVHGWNFIGGAGGKNIGADNLEITRLYRDLHAEFDGMSEGDVKGGKAKKRYARYVDIKKDFDKASKSLYEL